MRTIIFLIILRCKQKLIPAIFGTPVLMQINDRQQGEGWDEDGPWKEPSAASDRCFFLLWNLRICDIFDLQ